MEHQLERFVGQRNCELTVLHCYTRCALLLISNILVLINLGFAKDLKLLDGSESCVRPVATKRNTPGACESL